MPWLQLIIPTDDTHAETLSDALLELGAVSVTMQDLADTPVLEPPPGATPLWSQTRAVGLFEANTNPQTVVEQLQAQTGINIIEWKAEPLEDQDWTRAWMDSFKPMQFGERLWVVPSNHSPPHPEATNLLLDPGLAFGTGTHPTTAMCLEWLDAHPPQGLPVIDYGCGSGILAIAAVLLGAQQVIAVDNDPQALLATEDNARKNGVADQIRTYLPQTAPRQACQLLLANILASPLITLAEHFAQLTVSGGQLVLSGILAEQAESVLQAYRPYFSISLWKQQEEWVCLAGKRH